MTSKHLYVVYVSPHDDVKWDLYPVYCAATSPDEAVQLVRSYAIDKLGYLEYSFTLSDPLLLTDFIS